MADIWMGWLKRESGKSGYACIGDHGRACGIYQFDYRYALKDFLTMCVERDQAKYADLKMYADLDKGSSGLMSDDLHAKWRAHAQDAEFCALQDEFAKKQYYDPAARYLFNLYGIDAEKHSAALRGSLFSFSIRSGQLTGARKFSGGGATEEELLRRAYAKYGNDDAGRWPVQLADALAYLETEAPAGKRNAYVAAFESFYGLNEADGSFRQIIDLYNTHLPHPRGYTAQYTDAWCAETASAAAIKAGVASIFPIECGCEEMINLAKDAGIWIEADDHVPIKGELMLYDWDDDGNGDCTGRADHIGAVVEIDGRTVKVIEGNKNNMVGYRYIDVNSRTIRGYISPRYEELDKMSKSNLKLGSQGPDVVEWQQGLMILGFCDCSDYTKRRFADGDFAGRTKRYTEEFQRGYTIRYGLTVDGKVDAADWTAMQTEVAKALAAKVTFTVEELMKACLEVTDYFKAAGYTYGNPFIAPWWIEDNNESACDRFVCEVLKKLGLYPGNRDAAALAVWLPTFCEKITDLSQVKAGDIVFVRNYEHVLICAGKNKRFDCGSKYRIRLEGDYSGYEHQPFDQEITEEEFSAAYRMHFVTKKAEPAEEPAKAEPARKFRVEIEEVKLGASGPSVGILQSQLKAAGYYDGKIDNSFGTKTDTAVREWQADKIAEGLPVGGADGKPDGVVGGGSWSCVLGVEAKAV